MKSVKQKEATEVVVMFWCFEFWTWDQLLVLQTERESSLRVLKRWKRFYIKHTEGNIHTDVLHYELCSDFSVSLWISFQFHRKNVSSVMFWSCVISVEMSVCAEEMLRNELCWFKGMNWIIWWIIRFNTFHVFIISLNMWAVSQNRLSVSDLNRSMENKLTVEPLHQNSAQLHPAGFISQLFAVFLFV